MTFAQAASVAFCAGFFLTIATFTMRTWRRIGYCPITTFTSGRPAEVLQLLIIWSIPAAMVAASWRTWDPSFAPFPAFARVELQAAGALLLGTGLVLFPFACAALGDSWRIGLDERIEAKLITTGLYSRLRHPIYTAFTLMYAGMFLCLPCRFTAAAASLGIAGFYVRALLEERFLLRRFGDAYRDYMERTGRLLPRP